MYGCPGPASPGPVALRFGYPAVLTGPRSHIAYTPTAEDMAADDWHVITEETTWA